MIGGDRLTFYKDAFLFNKDAKGKQKCIEDILGVELQSYCNELSGSTTGCYASEELYNTWLQTMKVLKTRINDYYSEYLCHVEQSDMCVSKGNEPENGFKNFVEFLEKCAKEEFDNVRLGKKPTL